MSTERRLRPQLPGYGRGQAVASSYGVPSAGVLTSYFADQDQSGYSAGGEAAGEGDLLAMLRLALPGTPGEDYPVLTEIPAQANTFSCRGRVFGGYYADPGPASRCQVG